MKKIIIFVALMALVIAGAASAQIVGSKHELTNAGGEIARATSTVLSACQFCHTPHLRNYTAVAGAPLWNRTLPSQTYTLYGGGTTLAGTAVAQPGENSKTCLSCHDGTVAIGDVLIGGNETAYNTTANRIGATGLLTSNDGNPATPDYNLTTNLGNEHPVGVVYNTNTAGLAAVGGTASNGLIVTGNSTKRWRIYGGVSGAGKVECGSCHDPHNTTAGETPFLKGTKNTICTDCHATK